MPDSFFTALLSGRISSLRDDSGAFFIDRDPTLFSIILNYLRSRDVDLRTVDMRSLRNEAEFYGIIPLVKRLALCEDLNHSSCGDVLFYGYLPPARKSKIKELIALFGSFVFMILTVLFQLFLLMWIHPLAIIMGPKGERIAREEYRVLARNLVRMLHPGLLVLVLQLLKLKEYQDRLLVRLSEYQRLMVVVHLLHELVIILVVQARMGVLLLGTMGRLIRGVVLGMVVIRGGLRLTFDLFRKPDLLMLSQLAEYLTIDFETGIREILPLIRDTPEILLLI